MNDRKPTVTEADLHAFADDLLSEDARQIVETWLRDHPEETARVAEWQAQNAQIRTMFSGYKIARPNDMALLGSQTQSRPRLRLQIMGTVAAAITVFAAGAVAGHYGPALLGGQTIGTAANDALAQEAQSAFLVYTSDVRHPVEVGADQEAHLATWLGKRMNMPDLKVPNLATLGFQLVGGRLLPVNGAAGAMFMYENTAGERLTVLLGHSDDNRETSFRFASVNSLETFYWIDGALGYAVTGEFPRDVLRKIAEECYRQFPA